MMKLQYKDCCKKWRLGWTISANKNNNMQHEGSRKGLETDTHTKQRLRPRCVFACMCTSACFGHRLLCSALQARERWRHVVNDNYGHGVYLSAEVERGRGAADWMDAVWGVAAGWCRGRKREAVLKMASSDEGWIVLCAESERREGASCGVFICQCRPDAADNYYVLVGRRTCTCLQIRPLCA